MHQKHDHGSDVTGTTAPVSEPAYGGPVPQYGQPVLQPQQTGYHPGYAQTTGVAPSSTGMSEMDGSHTGTMNSHHGHENPNPYAELHGAGYAR